MQGKLGASPKDVLGGVRPFVRDEILYFRLVQPSAQILAQLLRSLVACQDLFRAGPIGTGVATQQGGRKLGILTQQLMQETLEVSTREIPAGERRRGSPGLTSGLTQRRLQELQGMFGQTPIGGDLATKNREYRRAGSFFEIEDIIPGHCRSIGGMIVIQRAHTGITAHHVCGNDGFSQIMGSTAAEVGGLLGTDLHLRGISVVGDVGGADEAEAALVGNDENDPPVGILQDEGKVLVIKARDDDVAALHLAHAFMGVQTQSRTQDLSHPGAGGIDQTARTQRFPLAAGRLDFRIPDSIHGGCLAQRRVQTNLRAALPGIDSVQHHQATVFDPTIGIAEAAPYIVRQNPSRRMSGKTQRSRCRQALAWCQMVIKPETSAQLPPSAALRPFGQNKGQWPDDVRGDMQKAFPFHQRLAHQAKFVVFEVA